MSPNILTLGLPNALRTLGFDPPLPFFGLLYKEPLGYIEEKELKRKETIVHCCHSLLILESTSLFPFRELCVLPNIVFAGEITIKR